MSSQSDQQSSNERTIPAHIRDRQRAVAEREAARLARPEQRTKKSIGHADRKKSAVTSTPSGFFSPRQKDITEENQHGWCGPFSVARQMIAEREAEKKRREIEETEEQLASHPLDKIIEEIDMNKKRKAHPSVSWKGKVPGTTESQSLYAKRQKRAEVRSKGKAVPSLFQICINFLVDNFDYVESLGDVDNVIRSAIAQELVSRHKMNNDAFDVIADVGIESLEMVDCSGISHEQLSDKLKKLLPAGLRYLVVDQSGRCFGSKTVQAIIDNANRSQLFALSVGGAYLLKDADAAEMIKSISMSVASLQFKACPLLNKEFCKAISESFATPSALVELSLEDLTFNSNCFKVLLSHKKAFCNIKSLSLRRIGGIDDAVADLLLQATGGSIERLDLSDNHDLSDALLASIREYCPSLRALSISGLRNITSQGLEALFMHVPGMSHPPMLTSLNVGRGDSEAVTDDVLQLVTQAATRRRTGTTDQYALLGGLVQLDIQGSILVTDTSMETLVSSCGSTLVELNVSFCPKISDRGLGYLVDRVGVQLSKILIWGCAQISDEFLDGHKRVDEGALEIIGAWMKKTSMRDMVK